MKVNYSLPSLNKSYKSNSVVQNNFLGTDKISNGILTPLEESFRLPQSIVDLIDFNNMDPFLEALKELVTASNFVFDIIAFGVAMAALNFIILIAFCGCLCCGSLSNKGNFVDRPFTTFRNTSHG